VNGAGVVSGPNFNCQQLWQTGSGPSTVVTNAWHGNWKSSMAE